MKNSMRIIAVGSIAGMFHFISGPADAGFSCEGVDTHLTKQRRVEYARLIAGSLGTKIQPSKVDVMKYMQAGTWTVAYASVPVADPGYFFFETSAGTPKFKDVWGGVADKSEAPEIFKWATKLGANKNIASCFANTVAID
ncbi:hypothetical protein [Labrys neptuniae]